MGGKLSKAIDKAKYTNELDISYQDLTSLPPKNLVAINASGNKIKSVNNGFRLNALKNLKEVDLAGNKLTEVPVAVLKTPWITTLVLSFNNIQNIPAELKVLENLTKLEISGNQILTLPDIFDKFPHLLILKIEKNQLMDLPRSMAMLKLVEEFLYEIKEIYVKGNPWKKIPIVLAQIVTLETLDLSKGSISEIGVDVIRVFAKNEKIRVLDLSENAIKSCPEELTELFMLRELSLQKNPVKNWPPKVRKMMNLKFEFDDLEKAELWKK